MDNDISDKDKVLKIATKLVVRNLTPSGAYSRITAYEPFKREEIVKVSVETAMMLVNQVNENYKD